MDLFENDQLLPKIHPSHCRQNRPITDTDNQVHQIKIKKTRMDLLVRILHSSFEQLKYEVVHAVLLCHPLDDTVYNITADASNVAVGTVLHQRNNNVWEPLAFFSKRLSDVEQSYSTFDRWLLAIYLAKKHLRYFVEGRELFVCIDHKPITTAIPSKTEKTPRQSRHLN